MEPCRTREEQGPRKKIGTVKRLQLSATAGQIATTGDIEVKTTMGAATRPFFLSENERSVSEEWPDAFKLLRLYSFVDRPAAFELEPPLHERLALSPTNYRAELI